MQDPANYILEVLIAIGGILTGGLLKYFVDVRKFRSEDTRVDIQLVLSELKELNTRLEVENKELRVQDTTRMQLLMDLERTILSKDHQLMMIQATTIQIPYPYWIKERNGKMLIINDHYTKVYGITELQYKGKTDVDVWGKDIGGKFWEQDLLVIRRKRKWEGMETIRVTKDGTIEQHRVVKWPIFDPSGTEVMFLAGMSIPPLHND